MKNLKKINFTFQKYLFQNPNKINQIVNILNYKFYKYDFFFKKSYFNNIENEKHD